MEKKRVLIVTQEIDPYVNLSDISSIISNLPKHLNDEGMEIRILMPRFGNINERRHRLHEVVRLSGINIVVNDEDYPLVIKVASLPGSRLQVYFLDNEDFFKRKAVFKDENDAFFEDNDDRMIFFCKGVIETVKKFGWPPDIIHCHGWMTSLVPYYLKTLYQDEPIFQNTKVIYSLYNNAFNGPLADKFIDKMHELDEEKKEASIFETADVQSLYKGGSEFADALILTGDEIDESVSTYVTSRNGKPILKHDEEEGYLLEYSNFYQSLLENN